MKIRPFNRPTLRHFGFIIAVTALTSFLEPAGAASNTWAGGGGGTWDTGATANWSNGTWTLDDDAVFNNGIAITGTLAGLIQASSLTQSVNGTALTLTSGTLQLDGTSGILNSATNTLTINSAITLSNTNTSINANAGAITIGGLIGGSGGINKTGAGLLTLSAANSYSGGTTITSGTLQLGQTTGAAATGTFSLGGGTLQISQAGSNFGYASTINLTADSTFSNIGAGAINYTGTLTGNTHALNVNTGATRLYINSTTSGITQFNVTSGAMGFDLNAGNRGGGAAVVVSSGASLWVANQNTTLANNITLNGGTGLGGTGALAMENGVGQTPILSGTLTLNSGTSSIGNAGTANAGNNMSITGKVTGAGSLSKISINRLTLSNATNDYSGSTTITGGVLQANDGVGLPTGSFLSLDGGVLQSNNSSASFTRSLGTSGSGNFQFTANGGGFSANGGQLTVNIGGAAASQQWGTTVGSQLVGTLQFGSASANAKTLLQNAIDLNGGTRTINVTAGAGGDSAEISGNITNSTGTGALTVGVAGTGTLVLSGSNTFNGALTLTSGVTSVSDTTNLGGATANNNIVFNGGTLQVTGTAMTSFGSHAVTYNASKTITFDINNASNNFTTGTTPFVSTDTLTKLGAGTLTLGATTNALTTLNVNANSTVDLGSGSLTINGGGGNTIQSTTGGTITSGTIFLGGISGDIGTASNTTLTINSKISTSGTGTIFEYWNGASGNTGTIILTNTNNDFAGGVLINTAGTISVASVGNASGPLSTGTVTFAQNGSTLRYTGAGETSSRLITMGGGANTGGTIDASGTGTALQLSNVTNTNTANGTATLTLTGSGLGELTGALANQNGSRLTAVTKAGIGTWTLSGSNSYTGATTVSAGTLQLQANAGNTLSGTSAAMSGSSTLTVSNGGTVQLRADANTVFTTGTFNPAGGSTTTYDVGAITSGSNNKTLTLNSTAAYTVGGNAVTMTFNITGTNGDSLVLGGTANFSGNNSNGWKLVPTTANVTIAGPINGANGNTGQVLTLDGTSGNNIITGVISGTNGFAVTKSNSSTWTLSGNNTYAGLTTVSGGNLILSGTTGSGGVTVTGGTLTLQAVNAQGTGAFTHSNDTVVLDFSAATAPAANLLVTTSTASLNNETWQFIGKSGSATSQAFNATAFAANTSNALRFTQNGATTLTGSLGGLTRNAQSTADFTLPTTGSVTTTSTTASTSASSGNLLANSNNVVYGTVDGTDWATNVSGTIGKYTAYSSGTSNYTSNNNINVGVNDTPASAITVSTLRFNTAASTLTLSGSNTINQSGILVTSTGAGSSITGGSITSGNTQAELVVIDNGSLNIASVIANTGTGGALKLTLAGTSTSTTTLSGANTYTGATSIDQGAVKVGIASGLNAAGTQTSGALGVNSTLTIANNATASLNLNGFDLAVGSIVGGGTLGGNIALGSNTLTIGLDNINNQTYSGIISGSGNLNKVGTGTQFLNGANTYSGTTTILNGFIQLNSNSSLGTSTLVLNGGGLWYTGVTLANNTIIAHGQSANFNQSGGNSLTFSGNLSGDGTINSTAATSSGGVQLAGNNSAFAGTYNSSSSGSARDKLASMLGGSPNATFNLFGPTDTNSTTFNGGTIYIGALSGNAGNVRNSGGGVVTYSIGALNTNTSWSGSLGAQVGQGNTQLTKTGTGTFTITSGQGLTGGVNVQGGTLLLNAGGSTVVFSSQVLTLSGGTLSDTGTSTGVQSFASTTLNAGGSTFSNTSTGHQDNLAAITRNAGAAVNFTPGAQVSGTGSISTTTANNASGILGGYATTNGADWAAVSGTTITAYSGYTALSTLGGSPTGGSITTNYNIATGSGTTTAGGALTLGSLKVTDTGAGSLLDNAGNNVTFNGTAGGLLFTGGGSYTIQGSGIVGAGAANEFIANVNSGTLTISSQVVGNAAAGSLTKAGAGTLTLTGSNNYTGQTTLAGGTLNLGSANALTSGSITFGGGTLQYSSVFAGGANADVSSRIVNSTGAISIDTNGQNVTFASALAATYNSATNVYTGNIGGLTMSDSTGSGKLTLSASNSYIGATIVNSGTLAVSGAGTLGGNPGFYYNLLTVNGGTLDLGNTSQSVGAVNFNGGTTQNGTLNGLTYNGVAGTVSANLTGNVGVGLTKTGSSALTLSGSNTYAGGTTLSGSGTLKAGSANAFGTGTLTISSGATAGVTLDINGQTVGNALVNSFTGAVITNSAATTGTISSGFNAAGATGVVISDFTVNGTGDINWTGAINRNSGTGILTKTGNNTLTIDGTSVFTGMALNINGGLVIYGKGNNSAAGIQDLTITSGTLKMDPSFQVSTANAWSGAVGNSITINGGVWDLNSTGTNGVNNRSKHIDGSSGLITNTGTAAAQLTFGERDAGTSNFAGTITDGTNGGTIAVSVADTGSGVRVQTLSGSNSYSGGTTLNSGLLKAGNNNALGTGGVVNNNGGTLQLANGVTVSNGYTSVNSLATLVDVPDAGASATYAGNFTFSGGSSRLTLAATGTGATLNLTGTTTGSGVQAGFYLNSGNIVFANNASFGNKNTAATARIGNGGSVNMTVQDNATVSMVGPALGGGQNTAGLTFNLTVGGTGSALFKATTGGSSLNLDVLNVGSATTGTSTVNLNSGGTILIGGLVKSSTGANLVSTFNFNGGTLTASQANASFLPALTGLTAKVLAGGAKVDDGGFAITIAQSLVSGTATDGGLTKAGTGTLKLTASNTYTGATTVTSGTLNLSNQFATQNSTVTMNGGSLVFDQTVAGNAFTFGGLAAASSGAGFDIALRNNAGSPAAVALTTGGNNASTTYSGVLSGSGSLTKTGTGTLTLTASNSYTGLTTVSNGTLAFDVSETLTGGLNVATSGTAVLTAHTGGAANVKVLDLSALTISGTTPFIGDGGKDLGGLASPAPVPEPGTIGLLAVGAIGGALLRRRNRKSGS